MTNHLILLRHGQSAWNLENRFTGFQDVDLTDQGREEARCAGARIARAGVHCDVVFSSTQRRAYHTAEITLEAAGQDGLIPKIIRSDALRERDYGDLTGRNKDEARAEFGEEQVHIWRRSYDIPPPGGESLKDVVENRVRPYFEAEIRPFLDRGRNVLAAAHGNSLRAMLIVLGLETPETINEAELPTGAPLLVSFEDGRATGRAFIEQHS